MANGIEEFVKIAPAIWPGKSLEVQPGNLSLFASRGIGNVLLGIDKDWSDPHSGHPFSGAPITQPSGGTVYFDERCKQEDIESMLRLMGVRGEQTDYAAFFQEATSPDERYMTQLRLVDGFALDHLYRTSETREQMVLRQQPLPLCDVIWRFIEWSKNEIADGRYSISGTLGGDGDSAYESLAFGFMVENCYYDIYRIWARAWLVTK